MVRFIYIYPNVRVNLAQITVSAYISENCDLTPIVDQKQTLSLLFNS